MAERPHDKNPRRNNRGVAADFKPLYFTEQHVYKAGHPLVRWLFAEMNKQQISSTVMAERIGTTDKRLSTWKRGVTPKLPLLEAAINVLGYELTTREKED